SSCKISTVSYLDKAQHVFKSGEEVSGLQFDDFPSFASPVNFNLKLLMLANGRGIPTWKRLHLYLRQNCALFAFCRCLKNSEMHSKSEVMIKESFDLILKGWVLLHVVGIKSREHHPLTMPFQSVAEAAHDDIGNIFIEGERLKIVCRSRFLLLF